MVGLNRLGRRKGWVQDLETSGQWIDQRNVGPAAVGHHGQRHPHLGACFDVPDAIVVLPHVALVVDCLVEPLDDEASVDRIEIQVDWRVVEAEAVVQTPVALFADNDVGVTLFDQHRRRDERLVLVGRAPFVGVLGGESTTQPDLGDKVRIDRLERVEEVVEGEQDERVLLEVAPPAIRLTCQQAFDHLRDQVTIGRFADERTEHDPVGAAVRMQQHEIVIAEVVHERRPSGGLGGAVRELAQHGIAMDLGGERWQQPGERVERQSVARTFKELRSLRVRATTVELTDVNRIRRDRVAGRL